MTNIVDNIDNLSASQLRVTKEHLEFDLERFMNGRGKSDGAVLLITQSQFVMTDCFESKYLMHEDSIKTIYSAIYGDSKKLEDNNSTIWE